MSEQIIFKGKLSLEKTISLGQNMAKRYGLSSKNSSIDAPEIINVKDFSGLKEPKNKVIKMIKSEHKKDFMENGNIQIGSFIYYQNHEDSEVGDSTEARFALFGEREDITIASVAGGGFNSRLFCCYDGEPNPDVIKKFDYNDSFEITNLDAFLSAISKVIHSTFNRRSKCLYAKHKIIQGNLPSNYDPRIIGMNVLSTVDSYKYFVKTSQFTHQNEYRFLWTVPDKVSDAQIFHCPEAIQFCKF